ncbi:Anaerobic dimethyl sulfoxide reductase chain C [Lonepinella sp. MS14434]|uniref:DmsC/YnfH family molybdoenzyme membrane anchor subunit n=1 Tax=Lonepinella sp. MS14434 TaxID=3003617 RepID=UPI0036DE78B5
MNGLHELPLVIFTVLAQSVVGAWLIFCVIANNQSQSSRIYLNKALLVLLILLGIGFIASILHLGTPIRAFNSLNRVGESMLSNEIAGGAVFFAFAGIYWLLSLLNKLSEKMDKFLRILTALCGLVFMYMMNNVYHIDTVPTWNSSLTSWQFYLTIVIGGCALGYTLWQPNPHKSYVLRYSPKLYLFAVFLAMIVAIYQGMELNHITTSVQQATALVPHYAVWQISRFSLLAIGGGLLYVGKNTMHWYLSAVIVLVAEMIGRIIFYSLHMTAGMAVGG